MKKLNIFGLSNQDTGVYWYRIVQPLRFIAKQKLANVHHLPIYGQSAQHLTTMEFSEFYAKEGKWADVMFTTVATNREYLALLLAMKEKYKLKMVVDLDDDIISTHLEPNNPGYAGHIDPKNRASEYAQATLREADLLVVSTDYLKRKYASINPNIVVVKNCIDPDFFPKNTLEPDQLIIGYAGSGSHQADWKMIEPVIEKIKKKHNAVIKMLGPVYSHIIDAQTQWVDMLHYPQTLASMGMDIAVAPLKDSMMARAKSNLRWLEYSALKIPTVASDTLPFRGDKNILLASELEDWEAHLEHLIKDKEFRTSLGENAHNEMKTNYDPRQWSRKLYDAIAAIC